MKKKIITKQIALILCVTLLFQMFVVPGGANWNMTAEAADTTKPSVYEDGFDYASISNWLDTDEWDIETTKHRGTVPKISDGVLKMKDADSVQFNWTNVIGLENYDSSKTYTFEFDLKVTDPGDGSEVGANMTRSLFVAPGGWYNQIQINDGSKKIVLGGNSLISGKTDTTTGKTVGYSYDNQKLHIKLEWQGTEITSTVTKGDEQIAQGYRVQPTYDDVKTDELLQYMVLRCEDGKVEIDNFSFAVNGTTTYTEDFDAALIDADKWEKETEKYPGNFPEISDGVLKMNEIDSVCFNWTDVIGLENYDSNKTYIFEFDMTVTDAGDNKGGIAGNNVRSLFVAPGGWYNQIEIKNGNDKIVLGGNSLINGQTDTTTSKTVGYSYDNQKLHIKLEWQGTTITSTVTKDGTPIATGYRVQPTYQNVATDPLLQYMVLRCEDGKVEIDNFSFAVDGTTMYTEDFGTTLIDADEWGLEKEKYPGTLPKISDGVLKMNEIDSVRFNWTDVIGLENYDSSKTYTFEFDMTVTDGGDNTGGIAGNNVRSLFVAPGGWYNQIAINDGNSKIEVGGTSNITGKDVETGQKVNYSESELHLKLEWQGKKITSTVTKQDGTIVATGYRERTNYADVKTDPLLQYMVLRCEDGKVEIDNFSFAVDGTTTYTENFGANSNDLMLATDVWDIGGRKTDAKAPTLSNGVIKMNSKNSLQFNWMKVPGVGEYDPDMTYTFEFDAKVTDSGNGSEWSGTGHTRILYVANGAWYTHIELNNKTGDVVVANANSISYNEDTFKDKTVHVKLEWKENTILSTITDADGNILVGASRTHADFTDMTVQSKAMQDLTLRCEDGGVEIDNFKFTKSFVEAADSSTTDIDIPEGQQAIYECKVNYTTGSNTRIEVEGTTAGGATSVGDLFGISDYGMAIGGYMCEGIFGEGVYGVKAYLNPSQHAVNVDVTLPDGSVIRRGSYQFLYDCTSINQVTSEWTNATTPITEENLIYEAVSNADYEIMQEAPDNTECGGNVYNLITSYDGDAKTTRSFAWTTIEGYVGESETMSVRYRKSGTETWTVVSADKETETTNVDSEDFFKADITGLEAGTSYEYQVGKTDSENEEDWSKAYTFTTEKSAVDEFSFVAIGDTQGAKWYGTTVGATTKGFQYTQAAISQAMKDVKNPAMILHTGDIAESGTLPQMNLYFKTLGDYGKTIPHFAEIGNHDVHTSSEYFDLHFNHPNNGGSDAFAEGTEDVVNEIVERLGITNGRATNLMKNADETVYSFDYGRAHFVALNTGVYDSTGEVDAAILEGQRAWLEKDLKANEDALWTIVFMHQPVYHRMGGTENRSTLHDTIEAYGVDLVIQGHSHLVTRTYPMKDGQVVDKNITDQIQKETGTIYTTIGATATNHDALSYGIKEYIHTAFTPVIDQATYTVVDVTDTELKFTVKQTNGLVVDEFKIVSEEKKIEYEYFDEIKPYRENGKSYEPKEGYVFAGWWQGDADDVITDDVNLIPITEGTVEGGAWAKYVPEDALSVKAQTTDVIMPESEKDQNPDSTKLRIVSTVDSLRYKEVGFKVKFNGGNKEYPYSSKTVYEELTAIDPINDRKFEYEPTVFAAVSDYFITYTFINISKDKFYNYNFDVTPYWITLDGTTVTGVQRDDLKISDQLEQ